MKVFFIFIPPENHLFDFFTKVVFAEVIKLHGQVYGIAARYI